MKQIKVKAFNGLIPALSFEGVKYEVIQDGWYVLISYSSDEDLFSIAFRVGKLVERATVS